MLKSCLIVPALLAFALATLSAQTPDTATLTGTVLDPTQAAIPGARISLTNQLTGLKRTALTNSRGQFSIAGLPIAGSYAIAAAKEGFASTTLPPTTFAGGTTASIALQLNVAGALTEVTVTGAAGELRTDEPQLGIHLDAQRIEETPLPNNRITFLPLLSAANRPAINQGDIFMDQNLFTTNGAGRRQSWFEVDGVSGNDSWGRQTIFTNIPVSAVQEMTVLTNSFSTEYGASTGSVVNIVTRSGGERYHGDLAALWRPITPEAALAGFTSSNATTGNELTNDRLVQASFSIGGPIHFASKTRFFLAAEHSEERKASPITSPLAPGSYIGVYHDWMGFLRVDHQFSEQQQRLPPRQPRRLLRHQPQWHRRRRLPPHRRPHLPPPHLLR